MNHRLVCLDCVTQGWTEYGCFSWVKGVVKICRKWPCFSHPVKTSSHFPTGLGPFIFIKWSEVRKESNHVNYHIRKSHSLTEIPNLACFPINHTKQDTMYEYICSDTKWLRPVMTIIMLRESGMTHSWSKIIDWSSTKSALCHSSF